MMSQIFAMTICHGAEADESDEHIFVTHESQHPYRHNETTFGCIHIPYAEYLIIQFDPRCRTDSAVDSLIFSMDEDCKEVAKYNKMSLSFS